MILLKKTALLLVPLTLLGAGCGKSLSERATEYAVEKAVEQQTDGNVDLDLNDGQISYTDNEGNKVQYGQNIALPSDFPKAVPVYKGSTILTTATTPEGSYLSLQSADSAADVLAWYETELKGWTKEESFDMQGLSARTFTNPGMKVVVTVASQDGQTMINVQYSEQK
jgi:hypothetical protein